MKINKNPGAAGAFGFAPIKAQNGAPKSQPASTVTKSGSDMRSKAGK